MIKLKTRVTNLETKMDKLSEETKEIREALIEIKTYIGLRKEEKKNQFELIKWLTTILCSGLGVAILNYYFHFLPTR